MRKLLILNIVFRNILDGLNIHTVQYLHGLLYFMALKSFLGGLNDEN